MGSMWADPRIAALFITALLPDKPYLKSRPI
jgi:hypothetical protein